MKWLSLFSMLPCAALGFQQVAPQVHYKHVERAEECITSLDFCDVDELETLADDLEQFQAVTQSQNKAKKVYEILRTQSELKRMMEDYATDDEPKTNGAFDDYMHYHW
mmetsp:Transcript_31056/g.65726  ORF Transcript_31056/g.65726 Transcript_31056/m.65726 type:complete len:108 (+) Transcript_31056:228-551(+)